MNRSVAVVISVVAILLVTMSPVRAEEATDVLTVEDFLDLERVSDPQLSPDAAKILYTRSWIDRMEDRWQSDIWIMNADGSRNRFLTKGSSPRWSPDGTRFAFTDEGEPKGTQLFVRWLDAAEATQITRVDNSPSTFKWSPDGKSIAFVMRTPADDGWKIDMPKAPKGAEWTEKPRVIEGVYFRQDRRGFMKEGYLHLFTVDSGGGTPRQLTKGKWNVGARTIGLDYGIGIDWTPDSKKSSSTASWRTMTRRCPIDVPISTPSMWLPTRSDASPSTKAHGPGLSSLPTGSTSHSPDSVDRPDLPRQ